MKNSFVFYMNPFEMGTYKGNFRIENNGLMSPKTSNCTVWGLASSADIPEEFRHNPNIVTSLKEKLPFFPPAQISAFFKFQKSHTSIFTEAIGMEVASKFNAKTCYSFPAVMDKSQESYFWTIPKDEIPRNTDGSGTVVYSFLGNGEKLISLHQIAKLQNPSVDVKALSGLILPFIKTTFPNFTPQQRLQTALTIQKDFAYQYLLRDYLGDIDYTSRNSGVIINEEEGYATLAPNFDFGQSLNKLVTSKFEEPKLKSIEDFPVEIRSIIPQSCIDSENAAKQSKFNAPVEELARQKTFEETDENITYICERFPKVAEEFRQDLLSFTQSGQLQNIISKYTLEGIITTKQGTMCEEFLQERGRMFEETLTTTLTKLFPDYLETRALEEQLSVTTELNEQAISPQNNQEHILVFQQTDDIIDDSFTRQIPATEQKDPLEIYRDLNSQVVEDLLEK